MYLEQLLISGLLSGAVLGLIGVGFSLVLGVGKVANFAHGAFVAVGLYAGYWIGHDLHLNPYLLVVPVAIVFGLIGWGVAEIFERRGRKVGPIGELLVGLALLLVLNGALSEIFGENPVNLQKYQLGSITIAREAISGAEFVAAVFTMVVAIGIYVFLRVSRWGRALRAVAENPSAAGLYGVRVPIAQRAAVVGSIVLAGISGLLISPFTVMTPEAGSTYLIAAFAVVILGGVGNAIGAVAAGLAIGVIDSIAVGYLSTVWTTLAPLIIILGFLLIRPVSVEV
ncbi:MAG: branched-chain amino acid transport system permease protein [Streptosporangiaceae bacterium]|nr:branched-chain amino acid transport system permease protein [Streptosporangiaceae bacterium]